VGDLVHREVPRCSPAEKLAEVAARMAGGWSWCAVVDASGVLHGRLSRRQVDQHPQSTAEEAMENGPSTYRPGTPARELLERMKSGSFEATFVTDSDGRLWGLVSRADLEGALGEERP
jgi:CBS-domain-containing membrane protein